MAGSPRARDDTDPSARDNSTPAKSIAVISPYAWSIPRLADFFAPTKLVRWTNLPFAGSVAVWGNGNGARFVERFADVMRIPVLKLEDGFLRSVGLAKNGTPPISILVDDVGLYLDAARASRLEMLVATSATPEWQAKGNAARARIVQNRLSKYNLPSVPQARRLPSTQKPRIVLVDQVRRDNSIAGALADMASFNAMCATAERRDATIVIRQHPDVAAGHRQGHLTPKSGWIVSSDGDSHDVLDIADEVWTVSSQLGFEGLLRGIPVTCYGMAFYSGYGLTTDLAIGVIADAARKRRARVSVTLDQFVAAAMLRYPLYVHPVTGNRLSFDEAVDLVLEIRAAHSSKD